MIYVTINFNYNARVYSIIDKRSAKERKKISLYTWHIWHKLWEFEDVFREMFDRKIIAREKTAELPSRDDVSLRGITTTHHYLIKDRTRYKET